MNNDNLYLKACTATGAYKCKNHSNSYISYVLKCNCYKDRSSRSLVIVMASSILLRVLSSAAFVLALLRVAQCQCQDYRSEDTTTCFMLFQRFQSALVGSELNLYNLRKTFAPASHPAPILVNVSYEIAFGYVSDDLCPGANNDSSVFNTSGTRYLTYGWTSSVLYTFIHPAELNRLQPQLVFLFLRRLEVDPNNPVSTALTWDGTTPISTAQLSLYVPSLPCSPTYEDVYGTLWDITSVVSATVQPSFFALTNNSVHS